MNIRKLVYTVEELQSEGGVRLSRPIRRAACLAVIANPYAGQDVADLSPLFDVGLELGELAAKRLAELLGGPAVSYGKAAIVGTAGEMEHGAAILHPKLGKPMRAAIAPRDWPQRCAPSPESLITSTMCSSRTVAALGRASMPVAANACMLGSCDR